MCIRDSIHRMEESRIPKMAKDYNPRDLSLIHILNKFVQNLIFFAASVRNISELGFCGNEKKTDRICAKGWSVANKLYRIRSVPGMFTWA